VTLEDRLSKLEGRYFDLFEKSVAGISKLTSQVGALEKRFVKVDQFLDDIDDYLGKRETEWREHISNDLNTNLQLAIAEMKANMPVFSQNKKLSTRQIVAIISAVCTAIGTAIATVIAAQAGVI